MKLRSRVAGRYAKALHDVASQMAVLDSVATDVSTLQQGLARSSELRAFIGNLLIPGDARMRVLVALFANTLHPLMWRFVRFLESKRRLGLLEEICEDFQEQEEVRHGIVRGALESAFALDAAQVTEFAGLLGRRLDKQLYLKTDENPELLGGGRLQVGDKVYDFSLSAQLRMMRQKMMAG